MNDPDLDDIDRGKATTPALLGILLCRLAQGGTEHDWETLIDTYGSFIRSRILGTLHDRSLADDAFQDTLLGIRGSIASFVCGSEAEAHAWIRAIAVHAAQRLERRERAGRRHETVAATLEQRAREPEKFDEDLVETLRKALVSLPSTQRRVIELRYQDGMDCANTARELGISAGSVEVLAVRARKTLRRRLTATTGRALDVSALLALLNLQPTFLAATAGHGLGGPSLFRFLSAAPSGVRLLAATLAGTGIGTVLLWSVLIRSPASAPSPGGQQIPSGQGLDQVRITGLTGEVWIERDPGRRMDVAIGTVLGSGCTLNTGAGGEARLAWQDGGHAILRASGVVRLDSGTFSLAHGGLVLERPGQSELRMETPHLRLAQSDGEAWVLAMPEWSRVDIVSGSGRVQALAGGAERPLSAGQATSTGRGCPDQPFPAAGWELSSDFGGLFFRDVADCYRTGRTFLASGPGPVRESLDVPSSPDSVAAASAGIGSRGSTATTRADPTTGRWVEVIRREPGRKEPGLYKILHLSDMPTGCYAVHQRLRILTRLESTWSFSFGNDALPVRSFRDDPLCPRGLPAFDEDTLVCQPGVDGALSLTMATASVGSAPDGSVIHELRLDADRGAAAVYLLRLPRQPDSVRTFIPEGGEAEVREFEVRICERPGQPTDAR